MRPSALIVAAIVALFLVSAARAENDDCRSADAAAHDRARARPLKVAAFFSILICGALGCSLPVLGRRMPALRPESNVFFLVKAFAAGVILATGFIHILPDAFENLMSDCLPAGGPWKDFPFAGLGAMVGAIGTLVVDTVATGYFARAHLNKDTAHAAVASSAGIDIVDEENQAVAAVADNAGHAAVAGNAGHAAVADLEIIVEEENQAVAAAVEEARHHDGGEQQGHVHVHAHGSTALVAAVGGGEDEKGTIRHRVLELGIVVHSVIIGISLGASHDPDTIKPLVVALSFHQMFEGMGLGGCIVQAKFKARSIVTMILFFCLTTPVGIVVGMGISSVYNENSPMALVVEGGLNSVAAGILVYMALVDFLVEDFMNPKVQNRGKMQLGFNVFMLLGAGLMSMLAKWA